MFRYLIILAVCLQTAIASNLLDDGKNPSKNLNFKRYSHVFLLGIHIEIDIEQNKSGLLYIQRFEAPAKSFSIVNLQGLNQKFQSHAVFQIHSFYLNVTLSLDKNRSRLQSGTNLGFVLRPNESPQKLHVLNDNFDEAQIMVAVVVYNNSAPIPGSCDEVESMTASLKREEVESFVVLQTPPAQLSNEMMERKEVQCGDEGTRQLEYFTFYAYLEQQNFSPDEYFKGIESLLFEGADKNGYKVSWYRKFIYEFPLLNFKLPGKTSSFASQTLFWEDSRNRFGDEQCRHR